MTNLLKQETKSIHDLSLSREEMMATAPLSASSVESSISSSRACNGFPDFGAHIFTHFFVPSTHSHSLIEFSPHKHTCASIGNVFGHPNCFRNFEIKGEINWVISTKSEDCDHVEMRVVPSKIRSSTSDARWNLWYADTIACLSWLICGVSKYIFPAGQKESKVDNTEYSSGIGFSPKMVTIWKVDFIRDPRKWDSAISLGVMEDGRQDVDDRDEDEDGSGCAILRIIMLSHPIISSTLTHEEFSSSFCVESSDGQTNRKGMASGKRTNCSCVTNAPYSLLFDGRRRRQWASSVVFFTARGDETNVSRGRNTSGRDCCKDWNSLLEVLTYSLRTQGNRAKMETNGREDSLTQSTATVKLSWNGGRQHCETMDKKRRLSSRKGDSDTDSLSASLLLLSDLMGLRFFFFGRETETAIDGEEGGST